MRATIKIDMDNAAFEDEPSLELARIIGKLAKEIHGGNLEGCSLMDYNGNKVGTYEVFDQ